MDGVLPRAASPMGAAVGVARAGMDVDPPPATALTPARPSAIATEAIAKAIAKAITEAITEAITLAAAATARPAK